MLPPPPQQQQQQQQSKINSRLFGVVVDVLSITHGRQISPLITLTNI